MVATEVNGKAESTTNGSEKGGFTAPDWLKSELFEEMLKKNVKNFKKIQNFKAKPGLAPGENYATVMLRLEFEVALNDGKSRTLTYMMKVPQENAMMQELMRSYNFFECEYRMYNETLPEFEQMYRDAGVKVQFGAQFYDLKTPSEFGVILLEDLCPAGFRNANRLVGLDMEHIECVLKKLAQFHAASAVRFERKGSYGEKYEQAYYKESQRELFNQMHDRTGAYILEAMKGYKGHEVYEAALRKKQANIVDQILQAAEIDPNEFNVLNHGDTWLNNIMFRYDDAGKVAETLFVDYQLPKYGSPALDLQYFLLTSGQLELKLSKFDYFIKYYHDHLFENLTLLKYPKRLPTLKDIHIQLCKYGTWAYFAVECVMGFVLCDPNDNANVNNFLNEGETGDNFRKLMYTNARYSKHMETILPWLYYRAALEC